MLRYKFRRLHGEQLFVLLNQSWRVLQNEIARAILTAQKAAEIGKELALPNVERF